MIPPVDKDLSLVVKGQNDSGDVDMLPHQGNYAENVTNKIQSSLSAPVYS